MNSTQENKFCFEVTKMLRTKFFYLYIFNTLCYVKFNFDITAQLVWQLFITPYCPTVSSVYVYLHRLRRLFSITSLSSWCRNRQSVKTRFKQLLKMSLLIHLTIEELNTEQLPSECVEELTSSFAFTKCSLHLNLNGSRTVSEPDTPALQCDSHAYTMKHAHLDYRPCCHNPILA